MALLDEAMAAAMTGDLGMLATGLSYCRTISACLDLFDYDRANDWIDAISKLPGPDQHGFPGDCLVHQVAVRIVRGEWAEARLEAEIAIADTERVDLTHAGPPSWRSMRRPPHSSASGPSSTCSVRGHWRPNCARSPDRLGTRPALADRQVWRPAFAALAETEGRRPRGGCLHRAPPATRSSYAARSSNSSVAAYWRS